MKLFYFSLVTFFLIITLGVPFFNNQAYAVSPRPGLEETANSAFGAKIPLKDVTSANIPEKIGAVIKFILSFIGALFFGLIVWGGLLWMTARGNEKQVGDAQKMMKNAIIGLAVVMASYAITAFVISIINKP